MSLAFLSKPIGGSKKDAGAEPDKPSKGRAPGPVRGGASTNVTVGGAPRADLMPPEIRIKRSQLRTRRSLRLALFGVFVLVVVACGGTWAWNALAQTSLASAQAQQQGLIAQEAKYSKVTTIQNATTLIKAGQLIGDSTEIDWQDYLTKLQATLPAGVSLSTVNIGTADPMTAYAQSTTPLEGGGRIATLAFSATSASLPSIPVWLDGLRSLPGFVDATPGSVSLTNGVYSAEVTMHIGPEAFANRFDPTKKDATGTDSSSGTGTSTDGGN